MPFSTKFSEKVGHVVAGECFASPLNANLGPGQYRSGFYDDIDKHFGSIGDFFQWNSIDWEGPKVMSRSVVRMQPTI